MPAGTQRDLSVTLPFSCLEARPIVTEALAREKFGVLTEIDVQAVLARKLGVSLAPYLILGACNPSFAHAAITADPDIGLLLPCNVVLREDGGSCIVSIMDPLLMADYSKSEAVRDIASQARDSLGRVIAALAALAG